MNPDPIVAVLLQPTWNLYPGLFWLVEPSDMRPYRDYNTALRHLVDLKRLGWQAKIENSEGMVLCE